MSPAARRSSVRVTSGLYNIEVLGLEDNSTLPRFRLAVLQVINGLRPHRAPSSYEAWIFRESLRSLHCSHELFVNRSSSSQELGPRHEEGSQEQAQEADPTSPPSTTLSLRESVHEQPPSAELLRDMISRLHFAVLPSLEEALEVIKAAKKHLEKLPNVVNVNVPAGGRMVLVGDLHGQLADMEQSLRAYGGPSERTSFLFNGDFVDRGRHGLEVVLTLFCYMLLYPETVHLNRGNHECDRLNRVYGFHAEVTAKYKTGSEKLYRRIQEAFLRLPLVYIVGQRIAVIHGGLPWDSEVTIEEIQAIDRFQPPSKDKLGGQPVTREERIYEALLWSDPKDFIDGRDWQPSDRGAGVLFGEGITRSFLKRNELKHLMRSHQVHTPGYAVNHGGLTTTVFTASNYAGTDNNLGCYLVLSPSLEVEFCQHSVLAPGACQKIKPSVSLIDLLQDGPMELAVHVDTAGYGEWHLKAKKEGLVHLWSAIFSKRQELLHEFEKADIWRNGTVAIHEWAQVCSECIHSDLPWHILSHYLVVREKHGRVPYMLFLERFQNRLVSRLMGVWSSKMLPFLSRRLQGELQQLKKPGQALSYQKLCKLLRQELPGVKERSVYYLMVTMLQTGYTATTPQDSDLPPSAVDLWALWAFQPHDWVKLQEAWRLPAPLVRGHFVSAAMAATGQVGKSARSRWQATATCLDPEGKGFVEWKQVQAVAENLGKEWLLAQLVLDIVVATASACVRLKDLFASIDVHGLGKLPTHRLVRGIEPWLGRRLTCQEALILSYAFDHSDEGVVTAAEFAKALEVVDTWDLATVEQREGMEKPRAVAAAVLDTDEDRGPCHKFFLDVARRRRY